MDIINHANTARLISRVIDMDTPTVPVVPYSAQKTKLAFTPSEKSFFFDEEAGVSAADILRFLQTIKDCKDLDLHNVAVSKNGRLAFAMSYPGYDVNEPHAVHSMSKSVTSLAIGILISEGKLSLNDKLTDIMGEYMSPIAKFNCRNICIEHLLTMTTGVTFNEGSVYADDDFLSSYFNSVFKFQAGKKFEYNSLNTYVLGAVVSEIAGMSLSDFVSDRIFKPAGIKDFLWESCPMGRSKGGWGLYLSLMDSLKLGELYLLNGKGIVPEKWIAAATKPRVRVGDDYGNYNYGYQLWCAKNHKGYLLNGMFGQNVFCYPQNSICLAVNGGLDDFFQTCDLYKAADSVFASDKTDEKSDKKDIKRLYDFCKEAKNTQDIKFQTSLFFDLKSKHFLRKKSYTFTSDNSNSVSVMPLVLQVIQNNYTKGLKRFFFTKEDGDLAINFIEGSQKHTLPIGFGYPKRTELEFNGEFYNVATLGAFAKDEEDRLVLKLRISFTETASTRFMRFRFYENGGVNVKVFESPGMEFVFTNGEFFLKDLPIKSLKSSLLNTLDRDFTRFAFNSVFQPTLKAKEDK